MQHSERFSLAGQVALVLGGSSGIGREIGLGLQDAGAQFAREGIEPIQVPVGVLDLQRARHVVAAQRLRNLGAHVGDADQERGAPAVQVMSHRSCPWT